MRNRIEMRKISDLQVNLFVRQSLDQDRVFYLAQLIENGTELAPIQVQDDGVVIDGRHRKEAYELLNRTEIMCEIVPTMTRTEQIAAAYRANTGNALPPTQADTEHTIGLLLDAKQSVKHIAMMLQMPVGMARRYVHTVQSKKTRQRLVQAAHAVTDSDMTVAQAVAHFEVDKVKLQEMLSGRRKKQKAGYSELQRTITKQYRSLGMKNAALFRSLSAKFSDADITAAQVLDIIEHLESAQRSHVRKLADFRKRFAAVSQPQLAETV